MCDECEYCEPKFDNTDGNYTDWVVAVRSRLSVALIGRAASIVVVISRLSVCTDCIIMKRCIPQPKFVLTACSRSYMRHVVKSEGYKLVSRSSQTLRYIWHSIYRKSSQTEPWFQPVKHVQKMALSTAHTTDDVKWPHSGASTGMDLTGSHLCSGRAGPLASDAKGSLE